MVRRLNFDDNSNAATPPATPTLAPTSPSLTTLMPQPSFTPPAVVPSSGQPVPPMTLDQIGSVGKQAQSQLSTVVSRLAQDAKLSDMDEMGKLLSDTMLAAKGYDPQKLFKGGLFGWLKAKKEQISMRFDSVDGVVNKLVIEVEGKSQRMRQRAQELEQMRVSNEQYAAELVPQFEHLEQVADWMEQNKPVATPNDMQAAQYLSDWNTVIAFARKRADDLRRAKEFAHQQTAIMGGMRTNAINLAQTLSDLKETSIPTLKTSFVLYVQNMEQKKTAEFADGVNQMTNEAARKNAEMLGQNTEAITRAVNRSNYELSTLQANYEAIINSIDVAARITAEEAQRRKNELPQIEKLGQDLTARLAQPVS